jgi:hypothetical protein
MSVFDCRICDSTDHDTEEHPKQEAAVVIREPWCCDPEDMKRIVDRTKKVLAACDNPQPDPRDAIIVALRAEVEMVTAERNAWRTALRNLTFTEGPDDPKAAVDHVAAYIADQIYDGVNLRGLALDVVDQLTSEYDDGEPTLCRGCECSGCSNGCAVNALRAALADTEAQR